MKELQAEKRFHNLTLEQLRSLDRVLTEVIPIHGRGNFPTLQVSAKDMIHVVKDRLVERDIRVKDIRLNGTAASHVLVRDNGLGSRDLDIIFRVELPRQEDFQVIKEVVLGSLRDLLPCGVNRRKITCLTMKEAYVQKMVKVFNEHDRWSLISLSNSRAHSVGLRFVSALRRQFEFSVDSFQIILDRILESYWEKERRQGGKSALDTPTVDEKKERVQQNAPPAAQRLDDSDSAVAAGGENPRQDEAVEKEPLGAEVEDEDGKREEPEVQQAEDIVLKLTCQQQQEEEEEEEEEEEVVEGIEDVHSEEDIVFEICGDKEHFDYSLVPSPNMLFTDVRSPLTIHACLKLQEKEKLCEPQAARTATAETDDSDAQETVGGEDVASVTCRTGSTPSRKDSHLEFSFPPPAKKTCSTSQDLVPDYCPPPKLQRKMSRKLISSPQLPDKRSLLSELSDLTAQLLPPAEKPKPLQPPDTDSTHPGSSPQEGLKVADTRMEANSPQGDTLSDPTPEPSVKPKHTQKPPDLETPTHVDVMCGMDVKMCAAQTEEQARETLPHSSSTSGLSSWAEDAGVSSVTVEAECMYGDFEQAMDHLHHRLIATHNPEEIRGGGLLKYSDLLVRNFKPASETEIKSLERYMCSRFFIDFPDVNEQQRKIEAYLQGHFTGNEEASKYDYLMTLRRVIDESTVCLMGHERRQTLNMITVLALRVLGEQNAIPNTANVTCFYQPAPYVTEPMYSSYFITPAQPPLVYHPFPLHVHMQTGLV